MTKRKLSSQRLLSLSLLSVLLALAEGDSAL